MPVILSHRGNLYGKNPSRENSPDYISEAVSEGYQVEVDIWSSNGRLYLGHDEPQYLVNSKWVQILKPYLWFHTKNLAALDYFISRQKDARFFWHQEDKYTLTSNGFIWTYPKQEISYNSILVILNKEDDLIYKRLVDSNQAKLFGICTDYPKIYE